MPSDAYMELSDPDTWGETFDQQFGETDRAQGAFGISSFNFGVTSNREDPDEPDAKKVGKASSGKAAALHNQPAIKTFTITKWIDKGSLDLFLVCCQQKKIEFAKIFLRETGDTSQKPWLWLEFTGVYVDDFHWTLDPGVTGEDAKEQETVIFSFDTILIKYSRQEATGEHKAVKIKGWDRKVHKPYGTEIEKDHRSPEY